MPQATSGRDSWMLTDDMVKDSLSLINVRRLHIGESVTCKSEEELICSYNWVENPEPTVYVPGELQCAAVRAHSPQLTL